MMRKRLRFLLFVLFTFCFVPSAAFAETPNGVVYSEETDSGNYRVFVCAPNRYEAGIYAVGGDPNYLSSDVRSKLSDPNYGGSFYTYCQTFEDMESFLELPIWVVFSISPTARISEFMRNNTTYSLYKDAVEDYKRVLSGEDLSGGGSGGNVNVSQCYELVCANISGTVPSTGYLYARSASIDSDGNVVIGSGQTRFSPFINSPYYVDSVRVYVPASMYNFLVLDKSGWNCSFWVSIPRTQVYATNAGFYVSDSPINVSRETIDNTGRYYNVLYFSGNSYFYKQTGVNAYYDSEGVFLVFSDADISLNSITGRSSDSYYSQPFVIPSYVAPPDGDWPEPENPVTPDPPEQPTPTAPTQTPDPSPTAPTVVWPTGPTVVNPPEVTVEVTPSELDYTELLTRINDNLNSIDSYTQAINASLNSLRTDVLEGFDDVVTSIRNVYRYLQHLNDVLEVHCKHIRDSIDDNVYELELYLKSLFRWLTDQLSYDELYMYDDTAVTSLLNRILYKIPGGNGPVTYKPNPQSDEPGFFDWLADLWHRFLLDLISVLPDELGGLVNAFSQLTHYFPFSIPWDLFALFALFEHEPVTPVFDIPWGYGGESGDVQMIRIDLSVWDGVMAMIRPVFIVGFCFKLAMITKDLLSNFDINKGGI